MALGNADLLPMLEELGVPVVYNDGGEEICGFGIVDVNDQDLLESEAATFAGRVTSVIVRTGAFPKLVEGAEFTLDGSKHRVVKTRRLDDGKLTRLLCHPI